MQRHSRRIVQRTEDTRATVQDTRVDHRGVHLVVFQHYRMDEGSTAPAPHLVADALTHKTSEDFGEVTIAHAVGRA